MVGRPIGTAAAYQGHPYPSLSTLRLVPSNPVVPGLFRPNRIREILAFRPDDLFNGPNLRYIQALLDHGLNITTEVCHTEPVEVYTHVSTKYLQGIINPMDALDEL